MSSNPNPTVPVTLFNADTSSINVVVNNGSTIVVLGAASPTYAPGSNSTGVTFQTLPATGVLSVGSNYVNMTPSGAQQPVVFTINIPANIQIISLQLYMFWESATTAAWVLLNNGQVIGINLGGGSTTSPSFTRGRSPASPSLPAGRRG
jgi:hypothetical protein